jgi:heat-inducible transcriptional repressor
MVSHELPDRSRRLLAALVREHIATGEPVSSQTLARESRLGVSSATIRNVFARLEAEGYLHQPHTSAGRVPTDRGYRVFVDLLLDGRKPARPAAGVENELRQHAERSPLMEDLLVSVTHMVSRASRHVGFAIGSTDIAVLQRIEFVPLGGTRVLVVVVSRGDQVTQKVVDAGEPIRSDDLVQAANYLTSEFAGLPLFDVRAAVLARLAQERTLYDQLMARALRLASRTFEDLDPQQSIFIQGTSLLFDLATADDPGTTLATMKTLIRMMEEKSRLVQLLDDCITGAGLTVVIGSEHNDPELQRFSLVTSTYSSSGRTGAIGLIGPTRMRYSRAIDVVASLSRAIDRVLDKTEG